MLSELLLSWGLSQPCQQWHAGCTYIITGNFPRHGSSITYITRVPGMLSALSHQPPRLPQELSVLWRSLKRREECYCWGWLCRAGTLVPPTCLPLQKQALWCEDLRRPSHHLQPWCSLQPPAVSCCCCRCLFGGAREMSPPMYKNKTHFMLHQ